MELEIYAWVAGIVKVAVGYPSIIGDKCQIDIVLVAAGYTG